MLHFTKKKFILFVSFDDYFNWQISGGSFGKDLKGDCSDLEVTANFEFLANFGVSFSLTWYKISLETHTQLFWKDLYESRNPLKTFLQKE
jgi:hypothetical protein